MFRIPEVRGESGLCAPREPRGRHLVTQQAHTGQLPATVTVTVTVSQASLHETLKRGEGDQARSCRGRGRGRDGEVKVFGEGVDGGGGAGVGASGRGRGGRRGRLVGLKWEKPAIEVSVAGARERKQHGGKWKKLCREIINTRMRRGGSKTGVFFDLYQNCLTIKGEGRFLPDVELREKQPRLFETVFMHSSEKIWTD